MIAPADVLGLAGRGAEAGLRSNFVWFRAFVHVHVAVRTALLVGLERDGWPGWYVVSQQGLVLCCLAALLPLPTRNFTRVAVLLLAVQAVMTLPLTANHVLLELVVLALLAFLDENDDPERELLGQALRWITVLFFFYSGLQKLLHGRYFDGQFLAYATATEERFAYVFRYLLPAGELQRLLAIGAPQVGSGPYRVQAPLFVIASNLTYVVELALPVLMMLRRTRTWATLAGIVFIVLIEVGAREVVFGAFMVNLLLLFLPGAWNKRLFAIFMLFEALMLYNAFGPSPLIPFAV